MSAHAAIRHSKISWCLPYYKSHLSFIKEEAKIGKLINKIRLSLWFWKYKIIYEWVEHDMIIFCKAYLFNPLCVCYEKGHKQLTDWSNVC